MGQIDSFKRVLGVAGQKTAGINAGIEVKEEVQPEVAQPVSPSVSSPTRGEAYAKGQVNSGGE